MKKIIPSISTQPKKEFDKNDASGIIPALKEWAKSSSIIKSITQRKENHDIGSGSVIISRMSGFLPEKKEDAEKRSKVRGALKNSAAIRFLSRILMIEKNPFLSKTANILLLGIMLVLIYSVIGVSINPVFHILIIAVSLTLALLMGNWGFFAYYILPALLIGRTKLLSLSFINMEVAEFIVIYSMIILLVKLFRDKKIRLNSGLELPVFFFMLFCFLSLINSFDISSTLRRIINFVIGFLAFYIVFWIIKKKQIEKLSMILVLMGTIVASISILEFFSFTLFFTLAKPLIGQAGIYGANAGFMLKRITGLWQDHNLSMIFNLFVPLCYTHILSDRKKSARIIYWAGMLILIFAIILTNTRTNILTLLAVSAIFFLFCNKKKLFLSRIMIPAAICVLLIVIFSGLGLERFVNKSNERSYPAIPEDFIPEAEGAYAEFDEEKEIAKESLPLAGHYGYKCNDSCMNIVTCDPFCVPFINYIPSENKLNNYMGGRIFLIKKGFELFKMHPFLGIGLGSYTYYPERLDRHGTAAHNIFVQILAEVGIFGFLAFLWLLGKTFKNDIQLLAYGEFKNNMILLGFSAGSLAVMIDGLLQNGIFYWQILALFWIYRAAIHKSNEGKA